MTKIVTDGFTVYRVMGRSLERFASLKDAQEFASEQPFDTEIIPSRHTEYAF